MHPIFTIHAGEYLVGNELEKRFSNCEVWVPSKDSGTDLLITKKKDRSKNVGIQVKFSKDFLPDQKGLFQENLLAMGWWTLDFKKIETSSADLWILAPYSFKEKKIHFVIIEPKELLRKLVAIHGNQKKAHVYLWVTSMHKCFESRGLKKSEADEIFSNATVTFGVERDFTQYLDNWQLLEERI